MNVFGGRLEEKKMEGWKDGRVEEGGMGVRMEEWRVVWVEEISTIKDECATDISKWMGREKGNEG